MTDSDDGTWILPAAAEPDDQLSTTPIDAPSDDLGDPSITPPASPGWHRRLIGSRTVVGGALLVVGLAGGVLVGEGLHSNSSTNTASGTTTPTQNGQSGSGFGGLPGGTGSNGYGYGGNGFGNNGFGGNGFPGFGGSDPFGNGSGSSGSSSTGGTGSTTSDGPTDAAAIAKNVDPGVVDITTTVSGGEAAGTGMVLTSNGEVLTNNHVIDGATSISVRDIGNGKTYKATVVGYDRSQDIAVLQLQGASGLTTVKTATSEPAVGATVVGIGNAGGRGGTPSYAGGAITGTNKSITASDEYDGTSERLTGLLATDADIEAGDSGGPLVNASGEVVGMDTAASAGQNFMQFGNDGSSTSRGFAIPITTALTIANQIENGESSETVHIGPTAALGVYISGDQGNDGGVTIVRLESGGAAAKAGLAAGDIITSVDGKSVTNPNSLESVMTTLSPGQTVTVGYDTSDGQSHTASLTLASGPPQ